MSFSGVFDYMWLLLCKKNVQKSHEFAFLIFQSRETRKSANKICINVADNPETL